MQLSQDLTIHKSLLHTSYPLDVSLFAAEGERMKEYATPSRERDRQKGWQPVESGLKVATYHHFANSDSEPRPPREIEDSINEMITELQIDKVDRWSPRYYYLPAGRYLPNYACDNTTCTINFLLSPQYHSVKIGGEIDGTVEGGEDVMYSQGVLDTTKVHGVDNREFNDERVLLKIGILHTSFRSVCNLIPDKYKYVTTTTKFFTADGLLCEARSIQVSLGEKKVRTVH